ncbi:MAG: catalase/peroxidase HPI [Myxococcales bacterium]|nr:catalase/peroxidase HPI [Myxococcales bacterium]
MALSPAHAAPSPSPAAVHHGMHAARPRPNNGWWPDRVDLAPLRDNGPKSDPTGGRFDYAKAFGNLDLEAVKRDLAAALTDSQPWWPADFGTYGPLFIRMAWHSAGTYRVTDGRGGAGGGQQRFEPLNSWPDNANLDKARRLLWPIKRKYGAKISWADLMVLAGNVAMEEMGFKTLGFAGGREDDWEADQVYWGPEDQMLADKRYHGDRELERPLAAVQMGLIYVNPEGPNGKPDPRATAHDIRTTFGRMAMNDEETVALIAGGHTFGKAHGAHKPDDCLDVAPAGTAVFHQGLGWHNKCGKGHSEDTVTSGLEGAWTSLPNRWTHQYLANLFAFDWVKTKSPAGAVQWKPSEPAAAQMVPDAHDATKRHAPMMFTTDLALKEDPAYREISQRFKAEPEAFEAAFAKAWFKLTHRDLGPRARYLGPDVPKDVFAWQDPIPAVTHPLVNAADVAALKQQVLASGLTVAQLVRTAWAAASTFRHTDMRGGANGARVRLAPQKDWPVNDPADLAKVLKTLEKVQQSFNGRQRDGKRISLADLVVLGGAAAIEQAAKAAGVPVTVPFVPGRADASAEQTDVTSFGWLEPKADGFRNHHGPQARMRPADALVEKADLLDLTPPEMTVLVGGLRVLGANAGGSKHGVFTDRPGTLSNDFFVNLLDHGTRWAPSAEDPTVFEGRQGDALRWTATEADLVFGSNAELRALAEHYAYAEAQRPFVEDFVAAWVKVMQADRFDLHR